MVAITDANGFLKGIRVLRTFMGNGSMGANQPEGKTSVAEKERVANLKAVSPTKRGSEGGGGGGGGGDWERERLALFCIVTREKKNVFK